MPGAQFADIGGGGLMAVVGILAALVGRAATGEGRYVDVSMLDGTLGLLPLLAANALAGVAEPQPDEFYLSGALPGYNVYETADGRYVTLGALEPKFWAEFCRRVGREDLIRPAHPYQRRGPRRHDGRAGRDLQDEDARRVGGRAWR